jgi:hypothetical protein
MARRKIATGDCESDPFKHGRIPEAFIWGIYCEETFYEFDTAQEMVEFLKDKRWIVYFHNGGKFDYHFMLDYLEPFDYIMDIHGRLAKFKIGECEFRDSYNILPVPLAAYKKDDFDYTKLEKDVRDLHMPEIRRYLKNDCIFLHELVSTFIDEYGVNLTLAGAAFKTFNKNFSDVSNQTTDATFYEDFKKFYFGGRVECFEKGIINKELQCVDINSAYPYGMLHDHPYGNHYETSNELPKHGVERCFIKLRCISQGALPFRNEDKTLCFPNDGVERVYTVTGHEYLAGLETKTIHSVEILEVTRFFQKINFTPYVNHFYNLKNTTEKGTADYIIAKLFLNSLYGKYAANPQDYTEDFICPQENIEHAEELLQMTYAGNMGKWAVLQRPLPEEKQTYYNVATAASITGFVRAYLWKAINSCQGVVYCDTDSIFCEKHHLDLNDQLGGWDVEGEFSGGGVGGKKLYCFTDKNKKGKYKIASKGARLTPEEILKVCEGETVLYKNIAPTFSLKNETKFIDRNIRMT